MKRFFSGLLIATCHASLALCPFSLAFGRQPPDKMSVNVRTTLDALVRDEDTDGDKKITVNDPSVLDTERGDKRF
jgi:hypothetical protein